VRGELVKDLNGTVTAVAKMGYQVVEFYSPYFNWTPEQAKDVRKLLDDLGIKCPSTHNGHTVFTPDGFYRGKRVIAKPAEADEQDGGDQHHDLHVRDPELGGASALLALAADVAQHGVFQREPVVVARDDILPARR